MSVASAGACARQEQVQNFPQLNACPHSLRAAASDSLAMLAAIRRVVADQELKPQPVFPRLRYRRHRDQHSRCRRPCSCLSNSIMSNGGTLAFRRSNWRRLHC
jgi:hypothetical protein